MARKSITELVNETRIGFEDMEARLESAIQTRDEYSRQLTNARARLRRKENTTYPDKLAAQYVSDLQRGNLMETSMIRAIDEAVEVNTEFQQPAYRQALYAVAQDKNIYKLFTLGTGWGIKLHVEIVFESAAGFLNEWAHGIERYRESIKTKGLDNEDSGRRATEWWYTNVYGTSLEAKTIKGRLEFSGRLAPFWQILNNGSQPLLSDRAGGYNPVPSRPTGFVDDPKFEIEQNFLTVIRQEHDRWFQETRELKQIIAEYEQRRNEYSLEVNNLKTDIRLNTQVYESFDEKREFIDRNKLADAIKRLRAGEEFEKPRVNIGIRGKRIYITIHQLEGIIEY